MLNSQETFIKLKVVEQELKNTIQELETFKYAIDQASIVSIMDHRGVIIYVNNHFCHISKFSKEELVGKTHEIVHSGVQCKQYFEEMWAQICSGKTWKGEICNKAKDGTLYWVDCTIVPLIDNNNQPYQYITIQTNITKRKHAEQKIMELLTSDELTGLPHRKQFINLLNAQLKKSDPVSLFIVNIARFTVINDTFGHDIGDQILLELTRRLKGLSLVILSRLTADEFAFYIPHFNKNELKEFSEYLITTLQTPFHIEGYKLNLSFRIGVSHFPEDGLDSDTLINNCRMAMRVQQFTLGAPIYHYKNDFSNIRAIQLVNELTNAIGTNQLKILYQPRVNIKTGEIIGGEVFLRWNHPELGWIDPYEYIAFAEEIGYIVPVGEWIMKKVCTQMRQWKKKGYRPFVLSIRFSPRYVNEKTWLTSVQEMLKQTEVNPNDLQIDLSINKNDYSELYLHQTIDKLKKIGFRVGFAHFGTNSTRLTDLQILNVDGLQIDRSLVKDIHTNFVNEEIVHSLLMLGNRLNKQIVVEGVNKREELKTLEKIALPMSVQGYIYSEPINEEEFELLLAKGKCQIVSTSTLLTKDRRKYYRIELPYPIVANLIAMDEEKKSLTKDEVLFENIGPGGVKVLTGHKLQTDQSVKLEFTILNKKLVIPARIIYEEEHLFGVFAYGMSFQLKDSERDYLIPLLNQLAIQVSRKKFVPDCQMVKEDKTKFLLEKIVNH